MDIRPPRSALTPFLRHAAAVVAAGPAGSSGTYRDTLSVGILTGAALSPSAGSPAQPAVADAAVLLVERSDWRAEFPPALGATFAAADQTYTVQHVQPVGSRWHLSCTSSMRARHA